MFWTSSKNLNLPLKFYEREREEKHSSSCHLTPQSPHNLPQMYQDYITPLVECVPLFCLGFALKSLYRRWIFSKSVSFLQFFFHFNLWHRRYRNEDEHRKSQACIQFGATRFGFLKNALLCVWGDVGKLQEEFCPLRRNKENRLKLIIHAVVFIIHPVQTFRKTGVMEPQSFIYESVPTFSSPWIFNFMSPLANYYNFYGRWAHYHLSPYNAGSFLKAKQISKLPHSSVKQ